RRLAVQVRRRRRQRKQGARQTPSSGHTREFKDHRHYSRGDDVRSIDWRLYARLDRLFVRVFEEVQELQVQVVVDASASMTLHPGKRREALRIAAGVGYLALAGGHRLALHRLDGGGLVREMPPSRGQGHVLPMLDRLRRMPFAGVADLAAVARLRGVDRRGLVVLVTDGYGADPATTLELLRPLRAWPAEAHLVLIADPGEDCSGAEGELALVDAETGAERRLWLSKDDIDRYRRRLADWRDEVVGTCRGWGVGARLWRTDAVFADQFSAFLESGVALGSA
ncbi:MAG: hypothetical protein RLZZ127_1336, partial [Planctomycetota bacterium]